MEGIHSHWDAFWHTRPSGPRQDASQTKALPFYGIVTLTR